MELREGGVHHAPVAMGGIQKTLWKSVIRLLWQYLNKYSLYQMLSHHLVAAKLPVSSKLLKQYM